MKATGQYFLVVLVIMLYNVALTLELFCGAVYYVVQGDSVDEILKCDHSNESYWAVLSCGAVYDVVQGDSNF